MVLQCYTSDTMAEAHTMIVSKEFKTALETFIFFPALLMTQYQAELLHYQLIGKITLIQIMIRHNLKVVEMLTLVKLKPMTLG